MVHQAKASHIGSALSIVDILSILYGEILTKYPKEPNHEDRDRFILSKGHACVALYATLAKTGYFPESELLSYGRDFSYFMHHISHKVPGVEFSTGSLGHGLPFGVGKALVAKIKQNKWKTFVLVGDGELQEGTNWEAIMFAAHHQLSNLVLLVDYNDLQSFTTISETLGLEPLGKKMKAFGWAVDDVDGHNHIALEKVLSKKYSTPHCIICRTLKGKGVSFMENQVKWHYKNPSDEELTMAEEELMAKCLDEY